jgi:hypothetical protein
MIDLVLCLSSALAAVASNMCSSQALHLHLPVHPQLGLVCR